MRAARCPRIRTCHRPPAFAPVIFLDDPWPGQSFDASRIAELWFRDRKTQVLLDQMSHLPPDEIAKADALFTWRDGKLIRVR